MKKKLLKRQTNKYSSILWNCIFSWENISKISNHFSFPTQVCTLLKYQTTDLRTCGEPAGSAFTKLEEFSLSGTFGTSYVFPQIVLSGSQLAPERHYEVGDFQEDKFLWTDAVDWPNENRWNNETTWQHCRSPYSSNLYKETMIWKTSCGSRLSLGCDGEFGVYFST